MNCRDLCLFAQVWLYRGYAAGLSGRTLTVYGLGMFTFGRLAFELCFRSIASSSVGTNALCSVLDRWAFSLVVGMEMCQIRLG